MMNVIEIQPMFDYLVTTMDKYADDELLDGGIIDGRKLSGTIKEYQKVVAVGSMVRDVKVGDIVNINPANYAVRKFKENSLKGDMMENDVVRYQFNIVELNHIPHLMLNMRDIVYVITKYEEETDEKPVIDFSPSLIV